MTATTARAFRWFAPFAALAAFALCVASPAFADDRDVLRDSAARPYVFIVLDNSGSMNLRPPCDDSDIAAGKCDAADRCIPAEGCRVPREGDDPDSKFRMAREALYEVLEAVDDVDFGFATMNQDQLRVNNKHWLYRLVSAVPPLHMSSAPIGGPIYPTVNTNETFGALLPAANCPTTGNSDGGKGCSAGNPINITPNAGDNNWEAERFRRLPKLGSTGSTATSYYHVDDLGGQPLKVNFSSASALGSSAITVAITVQKCNNPTCGSPGPILQTSVATYTLVGDYLIHDPAVSRTGSTIEVGWLGYKDAEGDPAAGCGWEPNTDSASDIFGGYQLSWPNLEPLDPFDPWGDPDRYLSDPTWITSSPSVQYTFASGDYFPFDWLNNNHAQILDHLGSKRVNPDANLNDDFGVASYFRNTQTNPDNFLRYSVANQRSMIPTQNPDLAWVLGDFRTWLRGCLNGGCPHDIGWDDMSAELDPTWACRRKFLLVVTDGDIDDDIHCSGPSRNACSLTASMKAQDDVLTYVIAFGRENTGHNILNCMSHNGGTGDPIYPKNKQQLVDALNDIIGRIREQAAAFASAAVPQVQANATDKIFLSSFTPISDDENKGYWAGRLDAFLKPLPLDERGQPDRSTVCDTTHQSQCFLWDAGDVQNGHVGDGAYQPGRLLLQAPNSTELAMTAPWSATQLMLGTAPNQRRVVYSQFAEPGNRRLFTYPVTAAERFDLWSGFGMTFAAADLTAVDNGTNTVINDGNYTVARSLVEKEAEVEQPDPANPGDTILVPITYLMGDIFHADPIVLGKPNNFSYYTNDPYLNKPLCGSAANPARTPPPSYRWFADRHYCRRSLLITAANDGQLHVFDGGTFGQVGSTTAECLLPAKDLDGNGTAETNEFSLSGFSDDDYDLNDEINGFKSCTSVGDCGGVGTCSGGFCTNVQVGVVDGAYSNGTGREVFSFIPRAMMKTVYQMAHGADRNTDFWGMDGSPRVDDVFIDPLATESSATCLNRQWRTVAIGGYREGGPGYYALDLTQPDTLSDKHVPLPAGSPAYVPSCFDGTGSGCASRPFPSVLWEFQDEAAVTISGSPTIQRLDEDLNGVADLANSWSRASTGRIRVCTGGCTANESEDRFVAVFGGGVGDSPSANSGGWIYMVDIETGKTLYKKAVIGSAAGDVAAIDYNGDGYIDRLYAGTVSGLVYKVMLESNPANAHLLTTQTIQTQVAGIDYNVTTTRITGPSGEAGKYDPFQVFSTGGKPIYHEISTIFVAQKNRLALAFGTGNRWNLWDNSGTEGRFYAILDDNWSDPDHDGVVDLSCAGCTEPLTESKYTELDPHEVYDPNATLVNYLYTGGASGTLPGWYFTLDENEKVITEAFSLAGVTIFTSFVPTTAVNGDGTCSKAGTSRIFIVGTVTAVGYSFAEGADGTATRARYTEIQQFTTPPFVERSATANPESGGGNDQHADFVTEPLAMIRDELKKLQSNRCRYAGYTQNIKTIRSDTGVVFVAPIPLCIDPTSWKEF